MGLSLNLRREEIEAQAQGLERFEGEWSGPAGTKENPTVVESVFNHRIVGIPRDDAGEAKWFHLHAGEAIEMDGQWFVLKQVSDNVLPEFERSHCTTFRSMVADITWSFWRFLLGRFL